MYRKLVFAPLLAIGALGARTSSRDTVVVGGVPAPYVVLKNGPNAVDLVGDGTKAEVFVAWRGNYNGHGHSTAAFYVFGKSDLGGAAAAWQLAPFFGGPHDGQASREIYGTTEGADCTLGDLRVVPHDHKPAEVILASRDFKKSYADSEGVQFDYYALSRNTDGRIGWPPYYFQYARTVRAKRAYCDVNEAFARELGLGRTGVGHGEGGR